MSAVNGSKASQFEKEAGCWVPHPRGVFVFAARVGSHEPQQACLFIAQTTVPHLCDFFPSQRWETINLNKQALGLQPYDVTISLKSAIPENPLSTDAISPRFAPRTDSSGSRTITLSKKASTVGRSVAIAASASP